MSEFETSSSLLKRCRALVADAMVEAVSMEGRFLLAWQAAVDVMNALVRSGPNGGKPPRGTHADRIEQCRAIAPELSSALDGINESRQRRNLIAYSGHGAEVDVLIRLLADVAAVDRAVERRMSRT